MVRLITQLSTQGCVIKDGRGKGERSRGACRLLILAWQEAVTDGSISGAFVTQMKKALNQLLREAKSDIVGWIIDTFMMVHSATMPPRVPKVHVEVFEARKKIHELEFSKMLAAPGGYDLANYPHMHAFHAKITDVGVRTCS